MQGSLHLTQKAGYVFDKWYVGSGAPGVLDGRPRKCSDPNVHKRTMTREERVREGRTTQKAWDFLQRLNWSLRRSDVHGPRPRVADGRC
jgi:hypothetical protein